MLWLKYTCGQCLPACSSSKNSNLSVTFFPFFYSLNILATLITCLIAIIKYLTKAT